MELSVSHLFIHNNQFLGVMKSSIIKDFHDVKLRIDFYKILTNDQSLVDMIKNNCENDHSNVNTLKLVSTDLVYSKILNYTDSENFVAYLRFINTRNIQEDMAKKQNWIIDFKFNSDVNFFKVILNSLQVLRLYTQVNSFYSNYLTLVSIIRQQILNESSETVVKQEKKVTEYIPTQEVIEPVPVVTPQQLLSREQDILDDVFELCLNSSIKSSLVHYTFNYFKYVTNKHCKILTNDKAQVQYTWPLLMPKNINEQYFYSLILSNTHVPANSITYIIKKILHNLYSNHSKYQENTLPMMMLGYLLFVYLLRYLYDSNRESFRIYFKQFICNSAVQNQLLTKMIEVGFSDFATKIYFKIVDFDLSDINDEYNLEKIEKLSSQYHHLIPVSQKEFANKIFKELQHNNDDSIDNEPEDFKLSCKKVIDVVKIMNNNERQLKTAQSVLFDPDNTLDPSYEIAKEYNFLDYKLQSNNGSKVITKAYQHLLNYIKNPSSILLANEKEVPKDVTNLFEILSKKVLNVSRIAKDNISTLNYYNILLKSLPNPKEFKHITFMYIIFQIMIPYHYDIYGNSQFEDVFL